MSIPTMKVSGTHYPHCKAVVEETTATIDGVSQSAVNPE